MLKQILSSENYWRSAFRLGFLFILVWSLVEFAGKYSFSLDVFSQEIIEKGLLFRYIRSRLVGGIFYGLLVAFPFQRRKIIEQRRKQNA